MYFVGDRSTLIEILTWSSLSIKHYEERSMMMMSLISYILKFGPNFNFYPKINPKSYYISSKLILGETLSLNYDNE